LKQFFLASRHIRSIQTPRNTVEHRVRTGRIDGGRSREGIRCPAASG
jgi:hypothetical protein